MADTSMRMASTEDRNPSRPGPLLFFRKFLKHGTQIGCLTASGKAMSRACCRKVDPTRPQQILELGAGTGAVTEQAVKAMHPNSRLLAMERDADLVGFLRGKYAQVIVVQGDAGHCREHLLTHQMTELDVVLSGLPLPSLPRSVVQPILECYRDMTKPGACFSQLAAVPFIYIPYYRKLFRKVHFQFVPWNFPNGGGVYHCYQLRPDFAEHLANK